MVVMFYGNINNDTKNKDAQTRAIVEQYIAIAFGHKNIPPFELQKQQFINCKNITSNLQ